MAITLNSGEMLKYQNAQVLKGRTSYSVADNRYYRDDGIIIYYVESYPTGDASVAEIPTGVGGGSWQRDSKEI